MVESYVYAKINMKIPGKIKERRITKNFRIIYKIRTCMCI